ncbi:MAG: 50S ribosomal protein L23 [Candidatus Micrarchaeota archaeon]|nr:50S ribosomal protein L23 [Candidatus Micrarchaeota archaeon]
MFVKYALTTEKAVSRIEKDNELVFIIQENATKDQVKQEIESAYSQPVRTIRTLHGTQGKKKAIVSFRNKGAAADLAAKLKVI